MAKRRRPRPPGDGGSPDHGRPGQSREKATGIAKMPYSLDSLQRSWSTTGDSKPYRSALRLFSATSPRVTMSTTRPPSRHSR